MKYKEGNVNTASKINHEERETLVQQREILLKRLKDLQFKLFDESSPEVVEHLNQLQLEKVKQQSLLKQAQFKLEQLEPQLKNFNGGAEKTLLEAISKQGWYSFKNKPEILLDSKTGLLFPNFEYVPHIQYNNWRKEKLNYAPGNIGLGKWTSLDKINYKDSDFYPLLWERYYRLDKSIINRYPFKFAGNKAVNIYVYDDKDSPSYGCYKEFSNKSKKYNTGYFPTQPEALMTFPTLSIFSTPALALNYLRFSPNEKAKGILNFFIEQDWIPNFEPFIEALHDDANFQHRFDEAQKQCDEYNRIFDAYYQRIQIQKQLVSLESQLADIPAPAPIKVITSDFNYRLDLNNYDLDIVQKSVWQYSQASQKWINTLLNRIDEWENGHLNLVKNTVELNQELDKKLPVSINVTPEEKQLLEAQLQHLKKRLDLGLTPLRSHLINLLSEAKQISSNLEQTNTLIGLAQLEQQIRPSFELLAEHTATLCTKTLKEMEWLDQSLDFVKVVVGVLRKSAEDYFILIDKYQQDLMQIGLDNSIEAEEITKWFAEWRSERLSLLKQIQPLLDAGLNKIIDEQTVLDVLPCIEQYQSGLDQFYLQKRLGIHTTYAFQANGHRQEKLEKEQELTKLVHQFMQQLEKIIFNTKTTAQKIWLIRFSEVWQQGVVNEITEFVAKEQLIERDDIVQIMSEELRKVQQQNLAACLQDAQSYSEALAQREKDVNTLIFKMRKALMK